LLKVTAPVGSLLLSNEGNGGDGGSKGDGYNDNVYDGGNGGFGLISIKSKYITAAPGQRPPPPPCPEVTVA
jgi:hypothetical protein